jgi:hypothetical protein
MADTSPPIDPVPFNPISLQGTGMPPPSTGLGKLAGKLVNVMARIGHIPKRGRNDFFNYDYATDADVADAVRKALVAERVLLIPSIEDVREREVLTRKNQKEIVTTITMEFAFIDGDTGQMLKFKMAGCGQDGGDKGILKAMTAATKYAALKSLCLPTGDDPEAEDGHDDVKSAPTNGHRDARAPQRESPSPSSPPWEDTPWPDDESSPLSPDRTPVSGRAERASAPPREPNRPDPEDCISQGKLQRLHAIMQSKARDYEWEFEKLREYVKRHVAERYKLDHLSDIPWKGRTYEDICGWVEALGAP